MCDVSISSYIESVAPSCYSIQLVQLPPPATSHYDQVKPDKCNHVARCHSPIHRRTLMLGVEKVIFNGDRLLNSKIRDRKYISSSPMMIGGQDHFVSSIESD